MWDVFSRQQRDSTARHLWNHLYGCLAAAQSHKLYFSKEQIFVTKPAPEKTSISNQAFNVRTVASMRTQ